MKVTTRFFAMCRDVTRESELELELQENATVSDFWQAILSQYPGLETFRPQSRIAVNLEYVEPDFQLKSGDEVIIIPPVSGG